MDFLITLKLPDLNADQILLDAALSYGVHDVTVEEAKDAVKGRLLGSFKAAAVNGAAMREQKAKEAAITGGIDATVEVG